MNKDMIQMAYMAMTIANGCNRTVAGGMLRMFMGKYATDEDLTDLFACVVKESERAFRVVINGVHVAKYNKIAAMKAIRTATGMGLHEVRDLVEMGEHGQPNVFTGGARDAFHLRDQLREGGYFSEVV